MITLWILLGLLSGVSCWVSGWIRGHDHATRFAREVVDRQLGRPGESPWSNSMDLRG